MTIKKEMKNLTTNLTLCYTSSSSSSSSSSLVEVVRVEVFISRQQDDFAHVTPSVCIRE